MAYMDPKILSTDPRLRANTLEWKNGSFFNVYTKERIKKTKPEFKSFWIGLKY